jgi:SAM-dependent methyltransferase
VECLILKSLIQQIDTASANWLPLSLPASSEISAWAKLHGWNLAESECQILLVRQALLNSALRQALLLKGNCQLFPTPLDRLGIEASVPLCDSITKSAQISVETIFNFWGELHNALIPQARRRLIGQFWTQEPIADWMIAWLLQARPQRLADIGCGAGNFLIKAAQRLEGNAASTQLYGYDVSPLLLNVTLAAFGAQRWKRTAVVPTLDVGDYFNMTLPSDTDAVICNPPYTRHHDIPPLLKDSLHAYFKARLQLDTPRQATLALYFLLKLIAELPNGARAAVILPMEVLDARYGWAARRVLCQYTSLAALVHFSPQMSAFHKVDVGASILLFQKGCKEQNRVRHLTLTALPTTEEFLECLEADGAEHRELSFGSVIEQRQEELPAIPKWFSIATA